MSMVSVVSGEIWKQGLPFSQATLAGKRPCLPAQLFAEVPCERYKGVKFAESA